jgi:hypothetical protein
MKPIATAKRIPPVGPETIKLTLTMSLEDAGALLALTNVIGGPQHDTARGVFEAIRSELTRLKVEALPSKIEGYAKQSIYFLP